MRMNGRVNTVRNWGYAVDLGASWQHGIQGASSTSSCPATGCVYNCPAAGCASSGAGSFPNYISQAAAKYGIKTVTTNCETTPAAAAALAAAATLRPPPLPPPPLPPPLPRAASAATTVARHCCQRCRHHRRPPPLPHARCRTRSPRAPLTHR